MRAAVLERFGEAEVTEPVGVPGPGRSRDCNERPELASRRKAYEHFAPAYR